MLIENIDTIYSNIFTKKHRFHSENKTTGGKQYGYSPKSLNSLPAKILPIAVLHFSNA